MQAYSVGQVGEQYVTRKVISSLVNTICSSVY